jgi:hypothetical protein
VERQALSAVRAVAAAALCALAVVAAAVPDLAAASPRHHRAYTTTPAPYRASVHFVVTYEGAGTDRTVYHSEPPNQGGDHDTNDVRDSSTQAWRLMFGHALAIPKCGGPPDQDPCSAVAGLDGAAGVAAATGRISHTHIDGLYRNLDSAARCQLRMRTAATSSLDASIGIHYTPGARALAVTAFNPVGTLLSVFPSACPDQGDSLDLLLDNYFGPAFSFDHQYSADRWFTSQEVAIPASVFHRSRTIRVWLRDTPAGTPPADCAVHDPSIERCATRGAWAGLLTFLAF